MVVASAVTFELITSVAVGFYTLITDRSAAAWSPRSCSEACNYHGSCGGFVWNMSLIPPCQLVVQHTEAGSTLSWIYSAYRSRDYGGKTLTEIYPSTNLSWISTVSACASAAPSMMILPYPTTARERALLSIRRNFYAFVDLQRRLSDGAYVDQSGASADVELITWEYSNPNFLGENCIGIGYYTFSFFDTHCEREDPDFDVMCLR